MFARVRVKLRGGAPYFAEQDLLYVDDSGVLRGGWSCEGLVKHNDDLVLCVIDTSPEILEVLENEADVCVLEIIT